MFKKSHKVIIMLNNRDVGIDQIIVTAPVNPIGCTTADTVMTSLTFTCFRQTPLDRQELLCGQLAGVSRCVSELSFSPVRTLSLRRNKFAVRMKDDFFWVSERTASPRRVSACISTWPLVLLWYFPTGAGLRGGGPHRQRVWPPGSADRSLLFLQRLRPTELPGDSAYWPVVQHQNIVLFVCLFCISTVLPLVRFHFVWL